jgi:putative salt-induced outer membrane protein YdiY
MGPDPVYQLNQRWNNYLTLMALQDTERVSLANTVYVQPRFDDPADTQIFDELSMRVSLDERFSLTLGLTVRYDSRPPRSVETYDVKLTQGFTVVL